MAALRMGAGEQRHFFESEHRFYSLFKNLSLSTRHPASTGFSVSFSTYVFFGRESFGGGVT